jgi:hypothetical protein
MNRNFDSISNYGFFYCLQNSKTSSRISNDLRVFVEGIE